MIEIDAVPSVPLFDDLFDSLVITGDEGLAISKEHLNYREGLTIGRDGSGRCVKNVLAGEPYQVVSSSVISVETFERMQLSLDGAFKRNGMIAADTLDGISYLVKWRNSKGTIRLVISNPDELPEEIQSFVARLDELLTEKITAGKQP